MKEVVTFGEIMLRLSPPDNLRLIQTDSWLVTFGGAEANVAVSLANYGIDCAFVTKLPSNPLGQAAINKLRSFGVDVSHILRGGHRIGIYFTEIGASQRPSVVVYDRANSAIAQMEKDEIEWGNVFVGKDWFHFTGITPALGESVAAATLNAVKTAKEMGLTVSCDLNYRKKLWTKETAHKTMSQLLMYVDVLIGNEEDAEDVFGIKADGTDIIAGNLDEVGYRQVAKKLQERFGLQKVAITLRESISASDNGWSALLYDGNDYYKSKSYRIHLVDRIGGGDAFGGGLIYALLNNYDCQKAVDFAVAASCLKQTIRGDFNQVTVEEVEKLAGGDASGRVSR